MSRLQHRHAIVLVAVAAILVLTHLGRNIGFRTRPSSPMTPQLPLAQDPYSGAGVPVAHPRHAVPATAPR